MAHSARGVQPVYLYMYAFRSGLYEKAGWRAIEEQFYQKHVVTIMAIECLMP